MGLVTLGDSEIGPGRPTYIIAEVGVNFLNSLANGRALAKAAARCGVDAFKTQLYSANKLAAVDSPPYWKTSIKSQREFFAQLDQLPDEQHGALLRYARELGLDAATTPFDLDAVEVAASWDVPWFKVASADITFLDLLRSVGEKGKPVLLSTGAATEREVAQAVRVIEGTGNRQIVLLHCTLSYTTAPEDAQLRSIEALQVFGYPVGLSDHTTEVLTPAFAVMAGACVIERHFGSKELAGGDNSWGADEEQMAEIVRTVELAEKMRGLPIKDVLDSEQPARTYARRSLAAARHLPAGTVLGPRDVIALRPGTGIPPTEIVVGRRLRVPVSEGVLFRREDLD